MSPESKYGKRIPLFTEEELAPARKHRKGKKARELGNQPPLIESPAPSQTKLNKDGIIDPERHLIRLYSPWERKNAISKDVRQKRDELANKIGLPKARGRGPYYKYLRKNVVGFDCFGIFQEHDGVIGEVPQDLETRIVEVRGLVDELLNGSLNSKEGYSKFKQFANDHRGK